MPTYLQSDQGIDCPFAGLGGSVRCTSDWRSGGCRLYPHRVQQYSFMETDPEIFSMVFLSLPLILEGQLSGERMCTSTSKPLGGLSLPQKK